MKLPEGIFNTRMKILITITVVINPPKNIDSVNIKALSVKITTLTILKIKHFK